MTSSSRAAGVFIVAAESSGDALGADLIGALRARDPLLRIEGVGGAAMAQAGIASAIDIAGLAVLGLIDGLKAYGRVVRLAEAAANAAIAANPACVTLIESWGFTLRVAQRIRARAPHIKLVKYIGPQVWATRPGRARTLARTVDHLICIHDFEVPFYAPYGLACTVCGHPAIGRYRPGDGAAFRARHDLGGAPLLLVLPGSRRSEVARTGPTLWRAAAMARTQETKLALVAADAVAAQARAQAPADAVIVAEMEKDDAFAAAAAALAASGTVTTEVALQGAPVVVGYKLGWITWALARLFLYKSKYATLMNVAARREVAPEFIQTRFTADNLARAAGALLRDPAARAAQIEAQNAALAAMGRGGRPAADIAAEAVLAVIADQPRAPSGT
ncbi:MAG: lipid-A-disaccharide synthase [Hyphomonadaceae bacterium]|nr:lipid-A-disaccharide synthase [Hyphomonadaceae bacterium]